MEKQCQNEKKKRLTLLKVYSKMKLVAYNAELPGHKSSWYGFSFLVKNGKKFNCKSFNIKRYSIKTNNDREYDTATSYEVSWQFNSL